TQIRTVHELSRPVRVMTTHSSWLMGSVPMGVDGIISGAGSVIPHLQVALFDAFQKGDLDRAQKVGDQIYAAVQAFYEAPYIDWQARMKQALVELGRMKCPAVRPPLQTLASDERLKHWLKQAGLTPDTVYAKVA
ncbi:MAG: dihydrodipicolinate synthase family protein, partial [Alcaligenaceae bacterium]|nr:dihydrodipicolinate synthase family protein [Alcaligenaceae bacterium]